MNEVVYDEKHLSKKGNTLTILGISIWKIFAYFIIYSIAGYIVETIYAIISKGTYESRQSFLYGPFCGIYGVGAVIMILFLQYFNKNNNRLFIGGFIVGSIVEYAISLFAEYVLHVKWWDYSAMPLNINGRICVYFSLFWGFLAIYFMSYVHPKIEKLLNKIQLKISSKKSKIIILALVIFIIIDCILTAFALEMFVIRKTYEYDLNVPNKESVIEQYEKIYGNEKMANFINTFFNDYKMIKTFPNLKTQAADGQIIYFDCLVGDIKPYYYKFSFSKIK